MDLVIEAYKNHKEWCRIVQEFGCNKDTAEDLVQEMYVKLVYLIEKGVDLKYENSVNYFYIYKILRSLFIDLKRKEARVTFLDDDVLHNYNLNQDNDIFESGYPTQFDYKKLHKELMETLEELYWYDRKVFELLDGEVSISELSRNTGISYYSLYNTYKKVKQLLKDKFL